jgi:hypothetical protein
MRSTVRVVWVTELILLLEIEAQAQHPYRLAGARVAHAVRVHERAAFAGAQIGGAEGFHVAVGGQRGSQQRVAAPRHRGGHVGLHQHPAGDIEQHDFVVHRVFVAVGGQALARGVERLAVMAIVACHEAAQVGIGGEDFCARVAILRSMKNACRSAGPGQALSSVTAYFPLRHSFMKVLRSSPFLPVASPLHFFIFSCCVSLGASAAGAAALRHCFMNALRSSPFLPTASALQVFILFCWAVGSAANAALPNAALPNASKPATNRYFMGDLALKGSATGRCGQVTISYWHVN